MKLPNEKIESKKLMAESVSIDKSSDAAAHPITGGVDPAIPPMTIFCTVLRFNHAV